MNVSCVDSKGCKISNDKYSLQYIEKTNTLIVNGTTIDLENKTINATDSIDRKSFWYGFLTAILPSTLIFLLYHLLT